MEYTRTQRKTWNGRYLIMRAVEIIHQAGQAEFTHVDVVNTLKTLRNRYDYTDQEVCNRLRPLVTAGAIVEREPNNSRVGEFYINGVYAGMSSRGNRCKVFSVKDEKAFYAYMEKCKTIAQSARKNV